MRKPEQDLSHIDSYPSPEALEVSYQFLAIPGYVYDRGSFDSGMWEIVAAPDLENVPVEVLKVDPEKTALAWIGFYQRAVIRTRHLQRFEGDEPGPHSTHTGGPESFETIRGELFPAAPTQLLVEATEEGVAFATVNEIVQQGSVTEFTERWLTRYSEQDNTRGFNDFLLPLLPLLDPKLSKRIKENKFD